MSFIDGLFVAPGWDHDRWLADALREVAPIYLLRGLPIEGYRRHVKACVVGDCRCLEQRREAVARILLLDRAALWILRCDGLSFDDLTHMRAFYHERAQDGLPQVFGKLLLEEAGRSGLHAVDQSKRKHCLHRVGVGLKESLLVEPRF